jgi:hypothetical protein
MNKEHPLWLMNEIPVTELDTSVLGFIYVITNLIDGRKYFGKKKSVFTKTSIKTITLKSGLKRKKKVKTLVPSDWLTYYGSSDELKSDVEKLGVENFKREILKFCYSLSELSYYEIKYQLEYDVLLHPDKFYNAWVTCRIRRDHLIKTIK